MKGLRQSNGFVKRVSRWVEEKETFKPVYLKKELSASFFGIKSELMLFPVLDRDCDTSKESLVDGNLYVIKIPFIYMIGRKNVKGLWMARAFVLRIEEMGEK